MKLNEFVDRLYAMGSIDNNKILNESLDDIVEESYNNDDFRDLCREYSSLYPYDISIREVWDEIVRNYEDEDLANDVVDYLEGAFGDEEEYDDEFFESLNEDIAEDLNDIISVTVDFCSDEDDIEVINYIKQKYNIDVIDYDPTEYIENATLRGTKSNLIKYLATEYQGYDSEEEGIDWVKEFYPELFDESLNEARNPENDEVNAVLRKWANSNRNRLSKRDQKILDDAGVKLEPYFPGEKEKIVVSSESERRPSGVYERGWGKENIRRMHPDHDIANDVKTDRELHISNPYNRNKNRWDYDDHQPNRETSAEARALRPYSDEYKRRKDSLEYARKHNWHKEEAEKALDDFRADMQAKKNESVTLNESKESLKDWFWSMIEDNEIDTETATGILLTYISDEDLLDAIDETKEYLES